MAPFAAALGTAMGTRGRKPGSPPRQHWTMGSTGGTEGWEEIAARSLAGTLNGLAAERWWRANRVIQE